MLVLEWLRVAIGDSLVVIRPVGGRTQRYVFDLMLRSIDILHLQVVEEREDAVSLVEVVVHYRSQPVSSDPSVLTYRY